MLVTDEQGQDESPHGELGVPDLDGNHPNDEHRHCILVRETIDDSPKSVPKMIMYHHSGTCLYLDMSLAWISGCSCIERLLCTQICLRKNRNAWVSVAVMEANDSP